MKKFKQKFLTTTSSISSYHGFTLIELIVVIAIIGILAAFLTVNYITVRQRARDAQRKSDLRQIQSALELYRSDQENYPTVLQACGNPFSFTNASGTTTTYMTKVPCDPTNATPYTYIYTPGPPGCDNSVNNYCSTYTILSCLENPNDSERDPTKAAPCSNAAASFTVTNP